MSYIYYEQKEILEHYPYASEVAEWLQREFGITTILKKPAKLMTSSILNELEKEMGLSELYFQTRRGLRRVYRSSGHFIYLIKEKSYLSLESGEHTIRLKNGMVYKYLVTK